MKAKILHNDSPFVKLTDVTLSVSRDDFAWSFSATIDCDYWYLKTIMDTLGYIKLQVYGALSIFGSFTLNVERISRSTKFNEFRMVTVSGRSRHVFGAEPLCPVKLFTIASDLPVTDVLELARVHYGYTADLDGDFTTVGQPQILWHGDVYTVKRETMNMTGTFTDVVMKLAELAGYAVVPDHRNRDMNIRPRYPELDVGWVLPELTPDDIESISYESSNVKGANQVVVSGNIAPYEVTVTKTGATNIVTTEVQHDLVHDIQTGSLHGKAVLDSQSVRDVLNVKVIRNKQRIITPAELIYVDDGVWKWLGVVTNSVINVKDNNGIPDYTADISVEVYSKSASTATGRFTNPLVLQPPWSAVPGNYTTANTSTYTVTATSFDEAVGVSYSGGFAAPFIWVAASSNVVVSKTSDYVFQLSKKAGHMTGFVVLGASDGYAPPTYWATTIDYSAVVVVEPNSPPVAVDNTATTTEGVAVAVQVLGNDYDVDGDTIAITAYTQSANGTVTDNGTGSMSLDGGGTVPTFLAPLTFTPAPGFVGDATFTYTIRTPNGDTDTATVTVTVSATSGSGGAGLGTFETVPDDVTAFGTGNGGTPVNAYAMVATDILENMDGFGDGTNIGTTTDGQHIVWLERHPTEGIVMFVYNINTHAVTFVINITNGLGYLLDSNQPPKGYCRGSVFSATGQLVTIANTYSFALSRYVWEMRTAAVTPTGLGAPTLLSTDFDVGVTTATDDIAWHVGISADGSTIVKWYPHYTGEATHELRIAIYVGGAEVGHTLVSSIASSALFDVYSPADIQLNTDGTKLMFLLKALSGNNNAHRLLVCDVNKSTGAVTGATELSPFRYLARFDDNVAAYFVSPSRLVFLTRNFNGTTELGVPFAGDTVMAASLPALTAPYVWPPAQPKFVADARIYLENVSGSMGFRCDELRGCVKLGTATYLLVSKRDAPLTLYKVMGL